MQECRLPSKVINKSVRRSRRGAVEHALYYTGVLIAVWATIGLLRPSTSTEHTSANIKILEEFLYAEKRLSIESARSAGELYDDSERRHDSGEWLTCPEYRPRFYPPFLSTPSLDVRRRPAMRLLSRTIAAPRAPPVVS